MLIYRGYPNHTLLFTGFPRNVSWRRVRLERGDAARLRYANFPTWTSLSEGSRRVTDGAANIDRVQVTENANANIHAVARRVAEGERFPELIGVEGPRDTLVILEGHVRVTAYLLMDSLEGVEMILGYSPEMHEWHFY